jgi:hypothetical protein
MQPNSQTGESPYSDDGTLVNSESQKKYQIPTNPPTKICNITYKNLLSVDLSFSLTFFMYSTFIPPILTHITRNFPFTN